MLSLVSLSLGSTSMGNYANPSKNQIRKKTKMFLWNKTGWFFLEYPGKCYISEDLILPPGEVKNPNADCERILCRSDGFAEFQRLVFSKLCPEIIFKTFLYVFFCFHSCGIASYVGYELGDYKDKSLPYPECCERELIPVSDLKEN